MLCVHCVPRIAHYCMVYINIYTYIYILRTHRGGRGIDSPHRTCPRLINNIMSGGYGIMCLSSWFSIRLDRTPTPKSRVMPLSLWPFLSYTYTQIHILSFDHFEFWPSPVHASATIVYTYTHFYSSTCEIWERCSFSCARDLFRYIILCSFLWKPKLTFIETLETLAFINISRHTWKTLIVIVPTNCLKRITYKLQSCLQARVACLIIYILFRNSFTDDNYLGYLATIILFSQTIVFQKQQ